MTFGELVDKYPDLKPGHGFLRMSFRFQRFEPSGVLRSIERTGNRSGRLVLVLGKLHPKTYEFDTNALLSEQSECWVWTPADEKTLAG